MQAIDPLANIRIVLVEASHPGNIGASARAMKTMGLTSLHLVAPQRFPDPESEWRAMRATDVLGAARVHATLEEALRGTAFAAACSARTRGLAVPEVSVREAAARLIEAARTQAVAVVFGNETNGLTTEHVNKCSLVASIPTNPDYSSLNLAAAVQVVAYELRMAAQAGADEGEVRALAPHEDVENFYAHLERLLAESGFFDPEHPKKLMPRIRRLFARAGLEPNELNILRGILKALSRPRE
jgi:tRNA/rRNA methyltransferase